MAQGCCHLAGLPEAASRGWNLPLRTDRPCGHGGSPQSGGSARTGPGGAAGRAGAEEGGPALSPSRPGSGDGELEGSGPPGGHLSCTQRSGLRGHGLLPVVWAWLVPEPSPPNPPNPWQELPCPWPSQVPLDLRQEAASWLQAALGHTQTAFPALRWQPPNR